jgi:hypothetical protein
MDDTPENRKFASVVSTATLEAVQTMIETTKKALPVLFTSEVELSAAIKVCDALVGSLEIMKALDSFSRKQTPPTPNQA